MPEGDKYHCHRCGRTWHSRIETKPVRCPACFSPYWDKPRQTKEPTNAE